MENAIGISIHSENYKRAKVHRAEEAAARIKRDEMRFARRALPRPYNRSTAVTYDDESSKMRFLSLSYPAIAEISYSGERKLPSLRARESVSPRALDELICKKFRDLRP